MPDDITGGMWGLALAAFVLGAAAGIAAAYLWVLRDKRAGNLQRELEKQQSEFEEHLQKVDEHFVRTSELFQEMTENYRAVYEHLAAGANDLCSDRVVAQRMGRMENPPLVERSGGTATEAPEAEKARAESPEGASGAWDETAEEPAAAGTGAEEAGRPGTEVPEAEAEEARGEIGTGEGRR